MDDGNPKPSTGKAPESYMSTLVKAFTIMCNTPLIEPETTTRPKVLRMKTLPTRQNSLSDDSSSMKREEEATV
ncbi:hypothetical protein D9611_008692 [Ephemerocybe angulata]|uniref:Uncharacterized protein n=1 Tax=Ephemerocybe angulata TaxID=980116 RepID=A0A8H5FJ17_9AGAR|nr:hypothetical protein D9611_008692 [Tulosesus angulatus]